MFALGAIVTTLATDILLVILISVITPLIIAVKGNTDQLITPVNIHTLNCNNQVVHHDNTNQESIIL